MRRRSVVLAIAILAAGLLVASLAGASGGKKNLKADALIGYQENPDISTVATGSFQVTIDDEAETLTYELSYSGLEGTVQQAHIHFGKRAINGGVAAFLCGPQPAAGDKPECPQSGTVTGVIDAADIIGPAGQGLEAGNFAELAQAMRAGHSYANVHSSKWPGGEIRAQINDQDANN